jgi:tetratricopeptide (TPR) repeat protein
MMLDQADLDALWDFADAAGSEARLRAAAAAESGTERAELETQVARALGLQERYAEADMILEAIGDQNPVVRVRVALERGRVRNSSGDPTGAAPLLREAASLAASTDLTFLRVDALHMLAIADAGQAEASTREALAVLEGVDDPRTLRWAVAVHNNAGWTLFDAGRFVEALGAFLKAKDAAVRWGTPQQVRFADEALEECRAAIAAAGR